MASMLGGGADVHTWDKHGRTPLVLHVAKVNNAEPMIAFLKAGASPDLNDSSGYAAETMKPVIC